MQLVSFDPRSKSIEKFWKKVGAVGRAGKKQQQSFRVYLEHNGYEQL